MHAAMKCWDPVDLGFASQRWQSFVSQAPGRIPALTDARSRSASSFISADALQAGDLYVVGAEDFADYRAQLLPWQECEPRLAAYCAALGIPERGVDFAAALKAELTALAARSTQVSRPTAS
jgi:hypothetical protein